MPKKRKTQVLTHRKKWMKLWPAWMNVLKRLKEQYKDKVNEKGVKKGIKDNCPETYKVMYPNE